jgi:4-amino-4-deoxy-L-arabinose transferase-like glycosyltransferase
MEKKHKSERSEKKKYGTILIAFLLFLIFAAALQIRIQYVNQTVVIIPMRADARQYVVYAYNLFNGTFSKDLPNDSGIRRPDSFRSPGYPLFIVLIFVFGGDTDMVVYAQAVLSALAVLITFGIGIQFLPLWGSVLASVLVAINPHLISMTSYVLTETLFSFTLLLSIFLVILAAKKHSTLLFIGSGLLFGYTYLINQTTMFIPFLFLYPILVSGIRGNKLLPKIALFLIIFSVFPAGWALRNAISLSPDAPRGIDRAIQTLSHGAYPGFVYENLYMKYMPYREDPMQPAFGASLSNFSKIFWARFKERPVRYCSWYLFEKPYYLWSWNMAQSQVDGNLGWGQGDVYVYPVKTSLYLTSAGANFSRSIMKYLHPAILVLALVGVLLGLIKYRPRKYNNHFYDGSIFLFLVIIYYTSLYTIFAPWPRYSVPLRPELYLFVLWTINILKEFILKTFLGNPDKYGLSMVGHQP